MLNRKFVAGITYNRKKEKPEIDNLYSHLKDLAKEEQNKSKANIMQGIIKIKAKIDEIENKNINSENQ